MSKLNDGDVTDVLDSFFIDYAIDDDADEESVRELMQQLSDMNKAVNEWYTKADAFDRIVEERNQAGTDMYGKEDDVVDSVIESAFWNIDGIIAEYESGESDG